MIRLRRAAPPRMQEQPVQNKHSLRGRSTARGTGAATDGDGPYGPYKVHRFLEDFPLLGDGEFADFVASVKRRGLMEPITLTHDRSTIVDGRIRYLACIEAGVDPVFETLPERYDDQMILDLIWTRNVYRQNLTVEQRAEIEQRAAAVYADFDGQLTGSGS